MISLRWITIAEVQFRFLQILNWGGHGMTVYWRGQTSIFQTIDFFYWDTLLDIADRRLELAGLEAVCVYCTWPIGRDRETFLRCLVRRKKVAHGSRRLLTPRIFKSVPDYGKRNQFAPARKNISAEPVKSV